MSVRSRSALAGVAAAILLLILVALGSRGFHWFDEALIGYLVGTVFSVAAVTYKYVYWLQRPPTRRYWLQGWKLFLSRANFRRYRWMIPLGVIRDLLTQQFIRPRSVYRWITHQCLFWGVLLSCCITFPLTFGWLRFTLTPAGHYQMWAVGFPLFTFLPGGLAGFLLYHALDWTALLLLVGIGLALHRRFHDRALLTVQRYRFDLAPLALLFAIAVSGLALTLDSAMLHGEYYWFISLAHEAVVVVWLISLPFGKFFHIIERPATLGVDLYWHAGQDEAAASCPRCGDAFAPARFIRDLKQTLAEVGENYAMQSTPAPVWWQDFCPACKRVMRAQANLAAIGPDGNRFL